MPFRVGHHFASDLVTYSRLNKIKPADIPFEPVQKIYGDTLKAFDFGHAQFPLTQERFRQALTARNMIASSRGLGGPQRAEVQRMLGAERARLAQDELWLKGQRDKLASAQQKLDQAFYKLGQ